MQILPNQEWGGLDVRAAYPCDVDMICGGQNLGILGLEQGTFRGLDVQFFFGFFFGGGV